MNLNLTKEIVDKAWDGILNKITDSDYIGIVDGFAKINLVRDKKVIYTFYISMEESIIHVNISHMNNLTYKCNVDDFVKEARSLNVPEDTTTELVGMVISIYSELRKVSNV